MYWYGNLFQLINIRFSNSELKPVFAFASKECTNSVVYTKDTKNNDNAVG